MTAPIPETSTAIVLLNWSSVRPRGTWKTPLIPIHVNSVAATVRCAKIRQLQIKLTSTAAIEIALLNVFHRSVNSVITTAEINGRSKTNHGSQLLMVELKILQQLSNRLLLFPKPAKVFEVDYTLANFCDFAGIEFQHIVAKLEHPRLPQVFLADFNIICI